MSYLMSSDSAAPRLQPRVPPHLSANTTALAPSQQLNPTQSSASDLPFINLGGRNFHSVRRTSPLVGWPARHQYAARHARHGQARPVDGAPSLGRGSSQLGLLGDKAVIMMREAGSSQGGSRARRLFAVPTIDGASDIPCKPSRLCAA